MISTPKYNININVSTFKPKLNVTKQAKMEFGEVRTPTNLVNNILDLFPTSIYSDINKRWLDVGAGTGQFSIELFKRLNYHLSGVIPEQSKRHHHILTKMMYMIEIQPTLVEELKQTFGSKANIWNQDFLTDSLKKSDFDCIIGNPPFNCKGMKKVPTNTVSSKRQDGKTIWPEFVRKSMEYVKDSGYVAMITPSLWMHQDKAKIFNLLSNHKICNIRSYSNTETNKLFKGQAQTPTSYFLVKKTNPDGAAYLFDTCKQEYIRFPMRPEFPLPVFGVSVINKLIPFVTGFGYLKVTPSTSPTKSAQFSLTKTPQHTYCAVKTCVLNKLQPVLQTVYFNQSMPFQNKPKIILAHKMYGFPCLDLEGKLAVSFRDNFIITISDEALKNDKNKKRLERKLLTKIKDFLSTKLALYIFEAARYRMKYLDKYAFQFIPDITKLPNLPTLINDTTLAKYFALDEREQKAIQMLHKKSYMQAILN